MDGPADPGGGAAAEEVLSAAAAFARDRVAPAAAGWAAGEAPAPALFEAAAALGLMRLQVPTAEGGLGHGFALRAAVCEALAGADFGFAMAVVNTHNAALKIATQASPAMRARFLPDLLAGRAAACAALTEPGAGSDFAAIATRAERTGDGWVLTGEKAWIINARRAAVSIVYAQCGAPGDRDGIAAFVVPLAAEGVRTYPLDSAFAQTAIGTGGFTLDGVRLSDDHLMLPPGEAFRSILGEINGARVYVAAMCCGMMQAALDAAADRGATRKSFGKPLAAHQGWRFAHARAAVSLAAARALTREAVEAVVADGRGAEAQRLSAMAKVQATDAALAVLPALMHAMGAEGLSPRHPFARHIAAAQAAALTDGSTEMLLERVARLLPPPAG